MERCNNAQLHSTWKQASLRLGRMRIDNKRAKVSECFRLTCTGDLFTCDNWARRGSRRRTCTRHYIHSAVQPTISIIQCANKAKQFMAHQVMLITNQCIQGADQVVHNEARLMSYNQGRPAVGSVRLTASLAYRLLWPPSTVVLRALIVCLVLGFAGVEQSRFSNEHAAIGSTTRPLCSEQRQFC